MSKRVAEETTPDPEERRRQAWRERLLGQPYGHEQWFTPHPASAYAAWLETRIAAQPGRPLVMDTDLTPAQNAQVDRQAEMASNRYHETFWMAMHELGYFCVHAMQRVEMPGESGVYVQGHAGLRARDYAAQGVPEIAYNAMLINKLLPAFPGVN